MPSLATIVMDWWRSPEVATISGILALIFTIFLRDLPRFLSPRLVRAITIVFMGIALVSLIWSFWFFSSASSTMSPGSTSQDLGWFVGGFLTVTLALILMVSPSSRRFLRPSLWILPGNDAEISYRHVVKGYRYGYAKVAVECRITDNGAAIIKRDVELDVHAGVDALNPFREIFPCQSQINDVAISSLDSTHPQSVRTELRLDHKSGAVELSFSSLPETTLAFTLTTRLHPETFAMNLSRAELFRRQTTYDYFGWHPIVPTRHLSIKVSFPQRFEPLLPIFDVCEANDTGPVGAPPERQHHEERKRREECVRIAMENDSRVLALEVDYPAYNLIYLFRWNLNDADEA